MGGSIAPSPRAAERMYGHYRRIERRGVECLLTFNHNHCTFRKLHPISCHAPWWETEVLCSMEKSLLYGSRLALRYRFGECCLPLHAKVQ